MRLGVWFAGLAVLIATNGCSSDSNHAVGASAGMSGSAGAGASAAGSGGNAGVAGDTQPSTCPELPALRSAPGAVLSSFELRLVLDGKPLSFGQANATANGGSLVPLNVRFYLSEVQLLRADAEPVPVDVVTASGTAAPYGVYFFNAEDPQSSTLRVLAPPGDYTGISFVWGMRLDCNQLNPSTTKDPLTASSQMTWPHTGFLFLRYEGRYSTGLDGAGGAAGSAGSAGSAGAAGSAGSGASMPSEGPPPAVHMGGAVYKEMAPRTSALGAFSIANGQPAKGLRLVMDEVFADATSTIDLSDIEPSLPPTPEVQAGERLRRTLAERHPFVLDP